MNVEDIEIGGLYKCGIWSQVVDVVVLRKMRFNRFRVCYYASWDGTGSRWMEYKTVHARKFLFKVSDSYEYRDW